MTATPAPDSRAVDVGHTVAGVSPERNALLSTVTEKQFQRQVDTWAKRAGWLTYHTWSAIHSPSGWPDMVMVRPRTGGLVFAELKTEKGKVTPRQQEWIDALVACGQAVYVWRPSDEKFIKEILGL